jgi:hypothetical protein
VLGFIPNTAVAFQNASWHLFLDSLRRRRQSLGGPVYIKGTQLLSILNRKCETIKNRIMLGELA